MGRALVLMAAVPLEPGTWQKLTQQMCVVGKRRREGWPGATVLPSELILLWSGSPPPAICRIQAPLPLLLQADSQASPTMFLSPGSSPAPRDHGSVTCSLRGGGDPVTGTGLAHLSSGVRQASVPSWFVPRVDRVSAQRRRGGKI